MNKKLFIAGNWKSNKTLDEAKTWWERFHTGLPAIPQHMTVVLCVPFTLLDFFHKKIMLAAQDISPFDQGAYTGEIAATQIKDFAGWVLIGHSERRKYFLEDDRMLEQKVQKAKHAGLSVIYCVSDETMIIPNGVDVIAYEPTWAIGTGKSDTPENANAVCTLIRTHFAGTVIYGGSVTPENVRAFILQPAIDGVLPGGASLDAVTFINLINAASRQ